MVYEVMAVCRHSTGTGGKKRAGESRTKEGSNLRGLSSTACKGGITSGKQQICIRTFGGERDRKEEREREKKKTKQARTDFPNSGLADFQSYCHTNACPRFACM